MRALVVDDDETIALLAKKHLKGFGFEVLTTETGLKAKEIFLEYHFDLLLMDLQMPECDGFEATRQIRAVELEQGRTKAIIVAMTAAQDKDRALSAGMNDYLLKPFLKGQLLDVLAKHFESLAELKQTT